MDFKRIFEGGYHSEYFIRAFFIKKDGSLDKKFLERIYDDGSYLWCKKVGFYIEENGVSCWGAKWFKEKPTEELLEKIWKGWWSGNPGHWMVKEYSGLDRLEVFEAQKLGDRWKDANKIDEYKNEWQPKEAKYKFEITYYADDDHWLRESPVDSEEFEGTVEEAFEYMNKGGDLHRIPFFNDILERGGESDARRVSDYEKNWKIKVIDKLSESKLKEGGNLTVNGHSATKLQVGKMDDEQFGDFKEDFLAFLLSVSDIFMEKTGYPIWNREDLLFDGKVFSGSTRAFFQKDHSTYAAKKPKVGDFDVQVPEDIFPTFHKFVLEDLPDMEIGDFTIHGCSVSPGQDHCLVKANKFYPEVGAEYIQIDWEYVPFKNNVPTDFATFAHYSSWEDIENNVKGVFMKYLMRALVSTIDERENVTIVSAKTGKPLASANKSQLKHFMGFSVDKGIRTKYIPYLDENGKPLVVDGQEYWVEQPAKESKYTQDVGAMYQLIFSEAPSEQDKKDLHSFVRTLNNLMSKFDETRLTKVFFMFCKLIWGPGAQGISAFDPEEDKEVKTAAYDQFLKAFPQLQQYQAEIDEMKDTYYSNYKVTEKK